ncbi:MAG: Asp-tRNA(Asn)/Glu-tRNA(Gln) amidotransferase subunit GatA [Vicinamibacterales bacterium]|nr:Asp-tRNA(Asn)/Glu-tRNA(Gln) amidotransferase subunit GatA [Vicinamibacterales bacterium]
MTASAAHHAFSAGDIRAEEICEAALARVAETDPLLNAFISVDADGAMASARALDARADARSAGPLAGVVVAIKDNICTRGLRTTAGSRTLAGFVPPYDATVISRLRAAGAIILGKTNCDEFAMGSSTEHSAFGPSRNPWDVSRTPGGSSGGSAAAVGARLVPVALGSDTGGSVRQPAGFCGITGIKPTYGRVSRYGLIAFASSLDQVGTFGVTVRDAASVLQVIAGHDARDATSAARPVGDWAPAMTGDIRGLRIGVPVRWIEQGVDADVSVRFREALDVLRSRGAITVDIELPHASHAIPVYYLVATAEASSNLARYDGVRYGARAPGDGTLREMYEGSREAGFGAEVKRRIMLGTFVLSAGYYDQLYVKALQVRALITRDLDEALAAVDAVATPTSPTTAFPLGERLEDPVRMYLADVFTAGAPLAGLPALSVPCGFDSQRLPAGLQLVGRRFDEATILGIADAYEREQPWWKQVPPGLQGA